MTYEEARNELAAQTSAQVTAAWSAYLAGTLTLEALTTVVASYVAAGQSTGATLGTQALAAAVTAQTGVPVEPRGVTRPESEVERLERAAGTIARDLPDDPDEEAAQDASRRFERLADAEVRQATADAHSEALSAEPLVTGWVRDLDADPCQLCRWWWREGRVWQPDHPMPRHTGCDCSQRVVTERTSNYQSARQAEDRARERRTA